MKKRIKKTRKLAVPSHAVLRKDFINANAWRHMYALVAKERDQLKKAFNKPPLALDNVSAPSAIPDPFLYQEIDKLKSERLDCFLIGIFATLGIELFAAYLVWRPEYTEIVRKWMGI